MRKLDYLLVRESYENQRKFRRLNPSTCAKLNVDGQLQWLLMTSGSDDELRIVGDKEYITITTCNRKFEHAAQQIFYVDHINAEFKEKGKRYHEENMATFLTAEQAEAVLGPRWLELTLATISRRMFDYYLETR